MCVNRKGITMSLFKLLSERLNLEVADEDLPLELGADEAPAEEVPAEEVPAEEEETNPQGDPEALVNALLKYAPGKFKEIKNMLKYAANSEEAYDIFDSSLDYYESIEDTLQAKADGIEEPKEELPVDEIPADEPVDELPETRNMRKNLGAP